MEELRRRLSLTRPVDTTRGIFCTSVLDVVRRLGGDELAQGCLEACGERRFVELFSYPMSTWLRMTYAAAWGMSERYGSFREAMWQMGHEGTASLLESSLGRMVLLLVHKDPVQLMSSLPQVYSMLAKAGRCSVRRPEAGSGVLFLERNFAPPPYTEGALHALFELCTGRKVQVSSRMGAALSVEYTVRWEEGRVSVST
jgi:uncharacterized protein (TIGR02265 family)